MRVSKESDVLQIYAQYVEPLEAEHRGEFVAISPDGKTLIGNNTEELRKQADSQFGEGSVIIKVGKLVSPGFRWLRGLPTLRGFPSILKRSQLVRFLSARRRLVAPSSTSNTASPWNRSIGGSTSLYSRMARPLSRATTTYWLPKPKLSWAKAATYSGWEGIIPEHP